MKKINLPLILIILLWGLSQKDKTLFGQPFLKEGKKISIQIEIDQAISYGGSKQAFINHRSKQFYIFEIKAKAEYKKHSLYGGLNIYSPLGFPLTYFIDYEPPLGFQLGYQYNILSVWGDKLKLFSDLNLNYFPYYNNITFSPANIKKSERFSTYGNIHYVYTGNIGAGVKTKVLKRLYPSLTIGYGYSFADRQNLDLMKMDTYSLSQLYARIGLGVDVIKIGRK